jgi:DNA-binding beta-propeller fold protein YncE
MNASLSSSHLCLRPHPRQILAFIRTSALFILAFGLGPPAAPAGSVNPIIATIDVGASPDSIVADPVRDLVYVAANNQIYAIDTKTNAPVFTLYDGAQINGLAVSPDGQLLFVTTFGNNTMDVFSLDLRQYLYSYTTGVNPIIPGVSPDGSMVYVPNRAAGTVTAFEGELTPIVITTGGNPLQAAFTPDGKKVYVTLEFGGACVIDTATHSPTNIPLGEGGNGLAITRNGSTVYVTSYTQTVVYAIATSNNSVTPITVSITGLVVLNFPALDASGKFLYVPGTGSTNEVITVETKTNAIFNQTTAMGLLPLQVAIKGKFGYSANFESNTVSVFKVK